MAPLHTHHFGAERLLALGVLYGASAHAQLPLKLVFVQHALEDAAHRLALGALQHRPEVLREKHDTRGAAVLRVVQVQQPVAPKKVEGFVPVAPSGRAPRPQHKAAAGRRA